MNTHTQDKITKYEGFIISENNSSLTVYINNKRIPIFVYLSFLLIVIGIFFFYKNFVDLFGFLFLFMIAILFIFIGLKNREDIPIISITNNYIEFIGKEKIKVSQIKEIKIETHIKFYYNLLGIFFGYPHRIIFISKNNSVIDLNITFALQKSAQNFISTINSHITKKYAK